jgi:hypothetical protein
VALTGTLKDFGIADILQLIGQQQKTGTLFLKSMSEEVSVTFLGGNIVRAETGSRKKKDLVGAMLVRAEIITAAQLEGALDTQRRTLQRLGDVLVSQGAVTRERFRQAMQLQAEETLYRLFTWKTGTYRFESGEVQPDEGSFAPLRADSILMEGFRQVDEWPLVRKTLPHSGFTFEVLKPLPEALHPSVVDMASSAGVGESERKVFRRLGPGVDARRLTDLCGMGAFETHKALSNLVNWGYLRAVPAHSDPMEALWKWGRRLRALLPLAATLLFLLALAALLVRFSPKVISFSPLASQGDPAVQRMMGKNQMNRIRAAIDVHWLEKGSLPDRLEALVEAGLLTADELRYPWREPYYYRKGEARNFVLLPPLR